MYQIVGNSSTSKYAGMVRAWIGPAEELGSNPAAGLKKFWQRYAAGENLTSAKHESGIFSLIGDGKYVRES